MFGSNFNLWLIVMIVATLVLVIGRHLYVEGPSEVARRIKYQRPGPAETKEMRQLVFWGRLLCSVGTSGVFVTLVQVPGLYLVDPSPLIAVIGYPLVAVIFWSMLRYLDGPSRSGLY